MDFLIFMVLVLVLLTLMKAFMPQIKGWVGETRVNSHLRDSLDPTVYHLIPDLMLPTEDGTTQIDHVVVSRYGIFVVETKNYTGWIFGKERDAQWTQQIYKRKERFQNPLRQNYKHTKTLSDLTGIPSNYFKSVVVFAGDSTFKTPMPPNVVYAHDCSRHIRDFSTPMIQDAQVAEVITAIREWAATVTAKQQRNHVAHVREKVAGTAHSGL